MSGKLLVGISLVAFVMGTISIIQRIDHKPPVVEVEPEDIFVQCIFEGDTDGQVSALLGDPDIEFPDGKFVVRWYPGYELIFSDNRVISVKLKPIKSEEEKLVERYEADAANSRLRGAYNALSNKEKVANDAWLNHEKKSLEEQRDQRKYIESYKERKAKEERLKIYTSSLRKLSCGCRHGHCHH